MPVAALVYSPHGTQAIFYERADVFTTSVHVDPGAG
jgi:acetoin utilization deacetylase AcuC-like enzyme